MVLMSDMLGELVCAVHLKQQHHTLPDHWTDDDWSSLYELARFHGLTPLIAHLALDGVISGIPETVFERFQKDLHQNRLFHYAAMKRLAEIESAFAEANIPATPLKGPRLSEQVYPAKGVRPFEDLDILIEISNRFRDDL